MQISLFDLGRIRAGLTAWKVLPLDLERLHAKLDTWHGRLLRRKLRKGGHSVAYTHDLEKFRLVLEQVNGVEHISFDESEYGVLDVLVVLTHFDWELRDLLLDVVEDFARNHVDEVTVLGHVTDAADAAAVASLCV